MSLDPRIRTFLEQAGLLTPPGSAPRAPEVLLEEMRANDEKAKIAAAQAGAAISVARSAALSSPSIIACLPNIPFPPDWKIATPLLVG